VAVHGPPQAGPLTGLDPPAHDLLTCNLCGVNNPLPVGTATRAAARVALVTCRELPDLDDDDRLLFAPLARLGITAEPAVWDDPAVDWAAYGLVVIRNPWDYFYRRDDFVAWASAVPRLANPAAVVDWNTDKRYLSRLADQGVPVVPTTWVWPSDTFDPPPGDYVIKPAVSAGSKDTAVTARPMPKQPGRTSPDFRPMTVLS